MAIFNGYLSLPEGSMLVGGLDVFLFSIIYGTILPIDELIFFKMIETTNQYDSVL